MSEQEVAEVAGVAARQAGDQQAVGEAAAGVDGSEAAAGVDGSEAAAGASAAETPHPAAVIAAEDGLIADELLVEEVSIDGMCGVY
jgi:mycofactocin precursor